MYTPMLKVLSEFINVTEIEEDSIYPESKR